MHIHEITSLFSSCVCTDLHYNTVVLFSEDSSRLYLQNYPINIAIFIHDKVQNTKETR